ncbi:hypothetical protein Poli38472_009072 [Pythium oligandrum]|uniref:6-pyruvoyltetrahydropterin synthase n=1 Tax=Pythium oligandrum TaxID=41045 RepID=A0A8K1FIE7_PYTOL|nr:hypothetical protein Poli38472_009072 [Pythium oligandrum]|eukprot:TMW64905.1 hypothetical protein Poli38472_009072 [Pythium oligandrum]
MLQPLDGKVEGSLAVEQPAPVTSDAESETPQKKRRKMASTNANAPVVRELTVDQKAIVKMNVTREATTDGVVKCCYCEKEITSKNVDRWASHLRGCVKTPEEVKMQIQPFRPMQTPNIHSPGLGVGNVMSPTTTIANANAGMTPTGHLVTGLPTHAAPMPTSTSTGYNEVFKVHVSKDYMKFNAAHFIAYKGFREKLHGHNYRVAVTITGVVGHDGYVVDFGEIKKISRVICKDLNESFLVPMNSDVLKITFDGTNVHILTEDMAKFSFPKADCSLLPIVHSSAEELAIYISNQIVDAFTVVALVERGVRKLEVSISEAHMQMASYERTILPSA